MKSVRAIIAAAMMAVSSASFAGLSTSTNMSSDTGSGSSNTGSGKQCPSAGSLFRTMMTDVCWSCLFPIKLAGAKVMGGDQTVPEGAADDKTCVCKDKTGIPMPGVTTSLWAPYRLIEVVRTPGCSPVLGGKILFGGGGLQQGGFLTTDSVHHSNFYHFNWYAMPLFAMLSLFTNQNCNAGGYNDFDLIYPSRLDPTWDSDELAMFTTPETVLFANPLAQLSCTVDCGIVSTSSPKASDAPGKASNAFFWCAGCWGGIYPFSGFFDSGTGVISGTSLLATRAIAMMHRRGLAHLTVGRDAYCGGVIFPTIYKAQYKMQQMYPVSESTGRCCHQIGETPFRWGEWRSIPGIGEDYVQLIWRYNQCCLTL